MEFEHIAYWYFRLNGFFTFQNFLVHDKTEPAQLTELDVLGFRFANRAEFYKVVNEKPLCTMIDDEPWQSIEKNLLVVADSKKSIGENGAVCAVNKSLWVGKREPIEAILYATGCCLTADVNAIAKKIYKSRVYEDENLRIMFCALGDKKSWVMEKAFPNIEQKTWDEILSFIHSRLTTYNELKKHHDQWDENGRRLYQLANEHNLKDFIKAVRSCI